jgi:hypothetical protein
MRRIGLGLGAAGLSLAAACAGEAPAVTAPSVGAPSFAVGDRNESYGVTPGVVNVCVFYPFEGTYIAHPTTLRSSAPAGENVLAGDYVITPLPSCIEAWNASSSALVNVATSLVAPNAGYTLNRIVTAVGDGVTDPTITTVTGTATASVAVNDLTGAYVWFKMEKATTPPGGGQGCTPGYWRQSHHFDSWTAPYTPTTPFSAVFANAFPGKTLHDVVRLGGGGLNALGRSAVAALLNAASPGVSYDYSTAEIISRFNAAYASGSSRLIEEQKNVFDFLNNQGCPLN